MKNGIVLIAALVVVTALCPFFCVASTSLAEQKSGITIEIPESATLLTENNLDSSAEILYKIGKTPEQMQALFDEGYAFYAFTNDEKTILSMTVTETELSKTVSDLAILNDDNKKKVITSLCGDSLEQAENVTELEKDGAYFYRVSTVSQKDGLSSIYYITVLNGYCVTLCCDSTVSEMSDNTISMFDSMFSGMSFKVRSLQSQSELKAVGTVTWLIYAAAIILCAVAVWAIVSASVELHRRRMETNWQQKIRKKPRR